MPPPPAAPPTGPQLDPGMLDGSLGYSGRANGSVIQYTIARAETIIENGHELLPTMGVATAINFQPSGATTASITGDFALRAGEVNAVAGTLRSNGIDVTASHQHHLNEQPRLFYMIGGWSSSPARATQDRWSWTSKA